MALVFDQSLFQTAASIHHIYQIIYDPVLQPKHNIQITKTNIRIHNHGFLSHHSQTSSYIGNCSGFSYTAFSGCNDNDFTHFF